MSAHDELLALCVRAADAGADVLTRYFRHRSELRLTADAKQSGIDLVTRADRESEDVVVTILRESGIPIVAEEGSASRVEERNRDERVLFVDPLDGTTNFLHGHPFFCVSIGLVEDGVPTLGVVLAPELSLRWIGTHAGGTREKLGGMLTDVPRALSVSPVTSLDDALLATGFPYDRRTSDDDNLAAHRAFMKRAHGVMRCGSAAIDLCLVADGTYDGFWERKLAPWDLAAGAALVLGAGGTVTNARGGPFDATSGEVVATNGHVHAALLAGLASHLPSLPPLPSRA